MKLLDLATTVAFTTLFAVSFWLLRAVGWA